MFPASCAGGGDKWGVQAPYHAEHGAKALHVSLQHFSLKLKCVEFASYTPPHQETLSGSSAPCKYRFGPLAGALPAGISPTFARGWALGPLRHSAGGLFWLRMPASSSTAAHTSPSRKTPVKKHLVSNRLFPLRASGAVWVKRRSCTQGHRPPRQRRVSPSKRKYGERRARIRCPLGPSCSFFSGRQRPVGQTPTEAALPPIPRAERSAGLPAPPSDLP